MFFWKDYCKKYDDINTLKAQSQEFETDTFDDLNNMQNLGEYTWNKVQIKNLDESSSYQDSPQNYVNKYTTTSGRAPKELKLTLKYLAEDQEDESVYTYFVITKITSKTDSPVYVTIPKTGEFAYTAPANSHAYKFAQVVKEISGLDEELYVVFAMSLDNMALSIKTSNFVYPINISDVRPEFPEEKYLHFEFVENGIDDYYKVAIDSEKVNADSKFDGNITIPETYNGLPVKEVYCSDLSNSGAGYSLIANVTSITLPDSIETISKYAFYGANITQLELPANLKTIEEGAFANCMELAGLITLPAGLQLIGVDAFKYNTEGFSWGESARTLDVVISGPVSNGIGGMAFSDCTIYVVPEKDSVNWTDGWHSGDNDITVYYGLGIEWEYDSNDNPVPIS